MKRKARNPWGRGQKVVNGWLLYVYAGARQGWWAWTADGQVGGEDATIESHMKRRTRRHMRADAVDWARRQAFGGEAKA